MNKKLILLILALPLFVMLCIYTTTRNIRLNVKVAVTGIEYFGESIVYMDMDTMDSYDVNYSVYPLNSANKDIEFKTEAVGDNRLAVLEFINGKIIPKSIGMAKVYLTTIDGGYRDSFIVKVDSVSVQEIESTASAYEYYVGETGTISTTFVPTHAINKMLTYSSSNTQVATVDNKGKIKAVGKGSAIITVASEQNSNVLDSFEINVYSKEIMVLLDENVTVIGTQGSVDISIDTNDEYSLTFAVKDFEKNPLEGVLDIDKSTFTKNSLNSATFNFTTHEDFVGSAVVDVTLTSKNEFFEPYTKSFVLNRVATISAEFDDDKVISRTIGSQFGLHNLLTITPANADVKFEIAQTNEILKVTELSMEGIRFVAEKIGVTEVTLKVINANAEEQFVELKKIIAVLPRAMEITNKPCNGAIEDIFTVGKFESNGADNITQLNVKFDQTENLTNIADYISFETDNENLVSVKNDGTIHIADETFIGMIGVRARIGYKAKETNEVQVLFKSSTFNVRCVGNGYNVRNFMDLYNLSNAGKVIVLQDNINEKFGLNENGGSVYTESSVKKIDSTYDTTFYKNIGKQGDAKVKVLISFTADVYGNGYKISSHNVAYGLDGDKQLKNNALFRGPLNFVALSGSNSSLVSVKAQDNISFAVYDDVTLNNIQLCSANLIPDDNGQYNLSDLDYVGTTVEVMGDNVNIEYCRINNGRTVLRVFGDGPIDSTDTIDRNKVINLNIKNSELSMAREFIIRIGSNCFVDGTKDVPAPYLDSNKSQSFPAQETYQTLTEQQKAEYDAKYVKTYVNIKNSILKHSGLFCIGMDSHFSGGALAKGNELMADLMGAWYDLAKTSYGAKLTFEGDVRMYDWKTIDNVDSSTLIEVMEIAREEYGKYAIEIKELINFASNNKPQYRPILTNYNNSQYVHGGIAFFGGGKNYCVFDCVNYTFKPLGSYKIGLDDVGRNELEYAAGSEKFYFLMHDSTTQGFSPEDQEAILKTPEANAPLYK